MMPLIPGLPEDIALDCIARVPHQFHAGLRPVCRRWRDLVVAPWFRRHRERVGAAEDLIFLVQALVPVEQGREEGDGGGDGDGDIGGELKEDSKNGSFDCRPPVYALSLYNATLGAWHRVAMAETIPMFAQCAAVGGKLVLVGGWDPATLDPVADVLVLDLATGLWRRGAPMATARSFFACAAVGGRVYVAGGHDGQKNALRSAEAYDVEADEWVALPAMAEERDECQGVARSGRFWAVSGYGTESQGRFDTAAECYDPAVGEWRREEGVWGEEEGGMGGGGAASSAACFAVAGEEDQEGRLWCVDIGNAGRRGVREYEGKEKGWRVVGSVPAELRSSPCAAVVGSGRGERVFLTGAGGEGGGHEGWVMEVGSKKWTRVDAPAGFSGFVYSATAIRI